MYYISNDDVLLYHVVSGEVDAATVVGLTEATTLQGENISIDTSNGVVLNGNATVMCHTNCGRPAQGTAFLDPPFEAGRRYRVTIRVDNKPGRMCYFLGVRHFSPSFSLVVFNAVF